MVSLMKFFDCRREGGREGGRGRGERGEGSRGGVD